MINRVYAIRDEASQGFGPLFVFPNDEVAKRACHATYKEPGSMHDFPEDYTCYLVGDFDSDTGELRAISPAIRICSLADFKGV